MRTDWRDLTPIELLASLNVFSFIQAATVLGLEHTRGATKGTPNPALVRRLVAAGRLRVIDPEAEAPYLRISRGELERFMAGTPINRSAQRSIGAA